MLNSVNEKIGLRKNLENLKLNDNNNYYDFSLKDKLTGLYNENGFIQISKHCFDLAIRFKKNGIIFCFNINNLKNIQEKYGSKESDFLLITFSEILKAVFRGSDIIGRLDLEEFTVLATDIPDNFYDIINARINNKINYYNQIYNKPYNISLKIFNEIFNYNDHITLEELITKTYCKANNIES